MINNPTDSIQEQIKEIVANIWADGHAKATFIFKGDGSELSVPQGVGAIESLIQTAEIRGGIRELKLVREEFSLDDDDIKELNYRISKLEDSQ